MLVGNEHVSKLVNPRTLPVQLYGMYCPKTVFGDIVLSGTIPGPGSISANISNNIVTLFNISCPLPTLPILEEAEEVLEPNMLNVAYQLSNLENLGISISNKQDEEK